MKNGDSFTDRHIGPRETEEASMLARVGVDSLDELIDRTVPANIALKRPLNLPPATDEHSLLEELRHNAKKNRIFRSYIGLNYHGCLVPHVILRNILENPGWYTQYTPYQAEISQGRLEALLNFQTMIADLTALPVANASLLDESTAAAEAMTMFFRLRPPQKSKVGANKFFVARGCLPQTHAVLETRSRPLGIECISGDPQTHELTDEYFGALLQYPDESGQVDDPRPFIARAREMGIRVVIAADPLALTLLTPPGELGADAAIGSTQRLGTPPGFGGPHAAYFATRDEFKRQMPGRIIGISVDARGQNAYRMALQTREQHIRREKATSNICTAQALLAIMAGMYGVYHGPGGLKGIATRIHYLTSLLAAELEKLGHPGENEHFFDTLKIRHGDTSPRRIRREAEARGINFRYDSPDHIGITLDETVTIHDVKEILEIFAAARDMTSDFSPPAELPSETPSGLNHLPEGLSRESVFMTHPVFQAHQSETAMMRYIKTLENRDLALNTAMIPLGSCTMKLNAAVEMIPVTWPEFSSIHPFAPPEQTEGYREIIAELERMLCEITGFHAVSFQPNSGAQGEFSGLMVIREFFRRHGATDRRVALIPTSAHGTNPASAAMAGLEVVPVQCDEQGNIDIEDLEGRLREHGDRLAALMITYPSTHGVFEEEVKRICEMVHEHGGQVYMDGANMNAQVGLTNPALIGADVCHLNLHKTFGIPHGGGGPGVGPICVAEHLAPYLPAHPLQPRTGGKQGIPAVAGAPYGSANILLISYAYIRLLGPRGLDRATRYAILNANYLKSQLEKEYKILFTGKNGHVAHEMIVDLREFKKECEIEAEDVAKRLMDYGFHAPTMSWPIPGTLMVEPTESEPLEELDRFCEAMLSIREEIREICDGRADKKDNVLKHAPFPAEAVTADEWNHPFSRQKAVYPVDSLRQAKFWPAVARIDNVYGDRNLICTCMLWPDRASPSELNGGPAKPP